jgi:hypothetical protein
MSCGVSHLVVVGRVLYEKDTRRSPLRATHGEPARRAPPRWWTGRSTRRRTRAEGQFPRGTRSEGRQELYPFCHLDILRIEFVAREPSAGRGSAEVGTTIATETGASSGGPAGTEGGE